MRAGSAMLLAAKAKPGAASLLLVADASRWARPSRGR